MKRTDWRNLRQGANHDRDTAAYNYFPNPVTTSSIRIYPTAFSGGWKSLSYTL